MSAGDGSDGSDDDHDADADALTEVRLPQLGEGILEGAIAQWLVQIGDRVSRDQPLVTLESDKITVELPSPTDGVLVSVQPTGQLVKLGEVIARIAPRLPTGEEALNRQHQALLAHVAADPHDLGRRLVYADFLLEAAQGRGVSPWGAEVTGLRGEYIHLYHRVRQRGTDPPEALAALRARLGEIGPRVRGTAFDLALVDGHATARGGFVDHVEVSADWYLGQRDALHAVVPLTSLALRLIEPRHVATLVSAPLGKLRALSLINPCPEAAPALLTCAWLAGLDVLSLRQVPFTVELAIALGRGVVCPRVLSLSVELRDPRVVRLLEEAGALDRLEQLDLSSMDLGVQSFAALVARPTNLTRVSLSAVRFLDDEALVAVAARVPPSVRELVITNRHLPTDPHALSPATWQRILALPNLASTSVLRYPPARATDED